jgi:biopolymer transport protein ExbD
VAYIIRQPEEKISLPKGSKTASVDKTDSIEIRVDLKRKVYIKDQVYNFLEFPDSFIQYASQFPTRKNKILIRADKRLRYEDVIYILRTVKAAKFTKVSLITDG